eukprot:COSAG06_NODE_31_length_31488_cov_60.882793_37_plen_469_part_00
MSERRIHAASPCLARLFLSSDPARACSRLEEPAGWVAAKAKKGDLVFKLMPRLPSAAPAFGLPKAVAMQPALPPCSGTLQVEVVKCNQVLPADRNGKSDVFVTLQLGKQQQKQQKQQKTSVKSKTLDPVFNEQFDFPLTVPEDGAWTSDGLCVVVELWDRDRGSANDFLGETTVALSDVFAEEHSSSNGGGGGWLGMGVERRFTFGDPQGRLSGAEKKKVSDRTGEGIAEPCGSVDLKLRFIPMDGSHTEQNPMDGSHTAARTAPAPEPEPQPAPPAMLAAPADEDPDDGDGGAADAAAAAATAAKAAAAAATAAAKAEHEQRQKAAAARKEREKQEAAAAAAARSAPVAAAPTPAPAPAPLGLPPSAAAPRPSSGGGGGGRVDTVAIEAKTRSQMEPLAERLTVAMRLLCSKRPAEPYAFLATAFRRYVIAPASLLPSFPFPFPFPFPFLSCSSLSCSRLEPTPTGR